MIVSSRGICTLLLLVTFSSCTIRKHIPTGNYLYGGPQVSVKRTPGNTVKTRPVKKALTVITFPKRNRMILGYPYKVGFWYGIGAGKRSKGFKNWLRNRLGEAPVLSSGVDLNANAENMTAWLENRGYFKSVVDTASFLKGYKKKALYNVTLAKPYVVDSIKWVLDSSTVGKDITLVARTTNSSSYLKPRVQFDLENIKAETRRIDLALKRRGYYYFSPDNIKAFVDTTVGNHKTNIYLSIKKETSLLAKTPQHINSIMLFPNYTLLNPPPDTSKYGLNYYEDVLIRDTVKAFKPRTLVRPLTYDTGSLYNVQRHNESLNRYINLGAFKFVKSRYEPSSDSVNPGRMDVFYYLTPLKKKTITAELGGFTKSNSFTGAQLNVNWKNRNLFRGAEQLMAKAYGASELSVNDSLKKNNNWRVGAEVSLLVPPFITPFKINESSYFPPFTKFTLSYEYMRRQLLFTKNFFRFQYDLSWKEKINIQHNLSPVSVTFNNATAFSDEYLQKVNLFPVLQFANLPELLLGSFYNLTTNTRSRRVKNVFFFNGSIDLAGNLAGLFNKPDSAFDKKIAGAYFAQYAKIDLDFRDTHKLTEKTSWVSRLEIGMGMPYGNSAYIPFSKQFIIGGANSLRGFRPRQIGPGRALTSADQQVSYPQIGGDYKLELQTELRFPLAGKLHGAVFAEAGNIWMKNDLLYGSQGKLTKQFMNDLAVDAGIGFRVDVTVLVIRLDIATPLRKPWLARRSEWTAAEFDLASSSWRKSNLIFNIGIGYPF